MFSEASWKGLWRMNLLCRLTAWGLGGCGGYSPASVPLERKKGREERERLLFRKFASPGLSCCDALGLDEI